MSWEGTADGQGRLSQAPAARTGNPPSPPASPSSCRGPRPGTRGCRGRQGHWARPQRPGNSLQREQRCAGGGVGAVAGRGPGCDRGSPRRLTLCAVPAMVAERPGGALGAAGTAVAGPALRVRPQAQGRLKVRGHVVAWGGQWVSGQPGPLASPLVLMSSSPEAPSPGGHWLPHPQSARARVPPPPMFSQLSHRPMTPAHCRWACPHLNRPHSCPPRHTAGGAPRRPCYCSGDAPGGSAPGGLRCGGVNSSP